MRPVSDRFLDTLRGSHAASTQAFVVETGQTGVTPTGIEVNIISGDVQLDSTASIRSTLSLTIDGENLFPTAASDPLAPYGNEVFIRRGIAFGGGLFEYVSLGYFKIRTVEQETAPNGPIYISGQDRMSGIVEGRLTSAIQFPSTDTYGEIVEALVEEIYPWATIEWDDDTDTDAVGRALIAEEDRYAFLNDLVTSVGKIWYWDHRGVLVIKDVPDETESVWRVNAGRQGVLVRLARSLSREGVYNGVVASGEALDTTEPPRALAVDDNPSSPTFWDGDFGQVPRFYSSPFITTDLQAASAAESILRKNLGLPYQVDFDVITNPALEPYDPITINFTRRGDESNYDEIHVIDKLTIPLTVEQGMSAETREQTLVVIGEG